MMTTATLLVTNFNPNPLLSQPSLLREIQIKFIVSLNSVVERAEDSMPFKNKLIFIINVVHAQSKTFQQYRKV